MSVVGKYYDLLAGESVISSGDNFSVRMCRNERYAELKISCRVFGHVMSWCASRHGGYTIGAMCMCVHLLSFGHVGFLSAVFDSGMLVDIVCASISCVNKNT